MREKLAMGCNRIGKMCPQEIGGYKKDCKTCIWYTKPVREKRTPKVLKGQPPLL